MSPQDDDRGVRLAAEQLLLQAASNETGDRHAAFATHMGAQASLVQTPQY